MIRYELTCKNGDSFEAWFGGSADYDHQAAHGLVECPLCGSRDVTKAPMAPAVIRGRTKGAEAQEQGGADEAKEQRKVAMAMAQQVQAHIRDNYDYVGERFPQEARKMHEGESEHRPIWGEASPEEARAMAEEGLPVAPLPPGLAPVPPRKVN
jgi:hypothetical protein